MGAGEGSGAGEGLDTLGRHLRGVSLGSVGSRLLGRRVVAAHKLRALALLMAKHPREHFKRVLRAYLRAEKCVGTVISAISWRYCEVSPSRRQ